MRLPDRCTSFPGRLGAPELPSAPPRTDRLPPALREALRPLPLLLRRALRAPLRAAVIGSAARGQRVAGLRKAHGLASPGTVLPCERPRACARRSPPRGERPQRPALPLLAPPAPAPHPDVASQTPIQPRKRHPQPASRAPRSMKHPTVLRRRAPCRPSDHPSNEPAMNQGKVFRTSCTVSTS